MSRPRQPPAGYWQSVHARLAARPTEELTGAELDELAAALFWVNEPRKSIEAHHAAFQRWRSDDRPERAARSAWHLFYEHWLLGEVVVARGWLERGRRTVAGLVDDNTGAAGWLAVAESNVDLMDGDVAAALERAEGAVNTGQRVGDADLVAMALQAKGRMLVASGDREQGLACLDDAMVSVIGNELRPLFTGWVYCNVIGICRGVGDLRRANEWSTAAMRWCESLREGLLYPGLCRVYAAELAHFRGDWSTAEHQARRACLDLAGYHPTYAASAHYLVGELCRRQGRISEAEAAFSEAGRLGYDPQPGLAMLWASTGRATEALASLRPACAQIEAGHDAANLSSIEMVAGLIEVEARAGSTDRLIAACALAVELAERANSELGSAHGLSAEGRSAAAIGNLSLAGERLSRSRKAFEDLGLPYEAAMQRLHIAAVAASSGELTTARFEHEAATAALARLGATVTENAPAVWDSSPSPGTSAIDALSDREREVLALVSEGLTNKEVGEQLHVSRHTVARHMSNIFTKLGVNSRTAAATLAVEANDAD